MIIEKYGVVLRKLEAGNDLELVRTWRNSPEVNQFMFFRDHITAEMQANWFKKIDNKENYYFIIESNGLKVGLTNLKDINYITKRAESGIFIGEPQFREGLIGVQATIAMLDYAFTDLGIKTIFSHILSDNKVAIGFNKGLGFKIKNEADNLYELMDTDYFIKKSKFEKVLLKL